jgi:hypothetical protein
MGVHYFDNEAFVTKSSYKHLFLHFIQEHAHKVSEHTYYSLCTTTDLLSLLLTYFIEVIVVSRSLCSRSLPHMSQQCCLRKNKK